jgi:hypothetical protein
MTRQEFIQEIDNNIWNLHDFCYDNGYDYYFDDIYSNESRDDFINEEMADRSRDLTWEEMCSWLNDFPPSGEYDWWYTDGWGEWRGVDDDYLEGLINDIANELEADGYFDEEEEEEEDIDEDDEEEDIDFGSFFSECHTESDRFISQDTDDDGEIDDLLVM